VVVHALAAGDAAHAENDDGIVYREEARERRARYVQQRGEHLSEEFVEAILGGYVREGMLKEDVGASVGEPQRTVSTRTANGLELTWVYSDDLQLSHRGWTALEVTFRQEFEEEQLEWLREHPEALLSGDAAGMIPEYRVVSVQWMK